MHCYVCGKQGAKRNNKIWYGKDLYLIYHFVCNNCFQEVKDGIYKHLHVEGY